MGSMESNEEFDPNRLSAIFGQVKFKIDGDSRSGEEIRPIGLARSPHQPLPYLAVLMELGNESNYLETTSKIKVTTPEPLVEGTFEDLSKEFDEAQVAYNKYRALPKKQRKREVLEKKKSRMHRTRRARDSCNRYSLSIRSACADVYGVLRKAEMTTPFDTLIGISKPLAYDVNSTLLHMRPMERLGPESKGLEWMREYDVQDDDDMSVDDPL